MPDFEIKITTTADLAAAKELKADLEGSIARIKQLGGDASATEAQLRKVNAALKGAPAGGALDSLVHGLESVRENGGQAAGAIEGIAHLLTGPFAAVVAIVTALATALKFLTGAVKEYMHAEVTSAKLDTALAQTGQLSEATRAQVRGLVKELKEATGIGGGEWTAAITKLIQFGADSSNLKESAEAVKNLAGIMGGDLQSAATLVSRALQGNFVMFGRYGIHVKEAATNTEKLKLLFEELALRGGGQLEARMGTLEGKFAVLGHGAEALGKGLGGAIVDFLHLDDVAYGIGTTMSWLAKSASAPIPVLEGLHNATRKTVQGFEDAGTSAEKYKKHLEGIKSAAADAASDLEKLKAAQVALKSQADQDAEAQKKYELAQVKSDFEGGRIGELQKTQRESAIGLKYSAAQKARDRELLQQQISTEQIGYNDNASTIARAEKDLKDAQAHRPAAIALETKEAELARLREELAKIQGQLRAAAEFNVSHPKDAGSLLKIGPEYSQHPERVEVAERTIETLLHRIRPLQNEIGALQKQPRSSDEEINQKSAIVEELKKELLPKMLQQHDDMHALTDTLRSLTKRQVTELRTDLLESKTGLDAAKKKQRGEIEREANQIADGLAQGGRGGHGRTRAAEPVVIPDASPAVEAMQKAIVGKMEELIRSLNAVTNEVSDINGRVKNLRNQ